MVRKLVVQPDGFMERKVGQPNMRWEIVTVLVVGVLGALGLAYVGNTIVNESISDAIVFDVMGIVATPILGAIVLWVGYSIGLHVISGQFNARGPVRRLFKLSAWALIPVGIGNLVQSAALFVVYQGSLVADVLGESPSDPATAVLSAGTEDPIYLAATVVAVLLILWTGYLMIAAVQAAKGLSRDDALKVVAIPVAAHFLYAVWSLLGSAGVL